LALTSLTSGGRSVGIVRLRTKGHGVQCFYILYWLYIKVLKDILKLEMSSLKIKMPSRV
jgi:hypothetical protein